MKSTYVYQRRNERKQFENVWFYTRQNKKDIILVDQYSLTNNFLNIYHINRGA